MSCTTSVATRVVDVTCWKSQRDGSGMGVNLAKSEHCETADFWWCYSAMAAPDEVHDATAARKNQLYGAIPLRTDGIRKVQKVPTR